MTTLESIILGALQGITEFLPVSSSAHLIVIPWLFKVSEANVDSLTYDVALHFGTLLALLAIYGRRLFRVVVNGVGELRRLELRDSLLLKLVVATLPAGFAGLLFKNAIETYLRTPYVTVVTLIAVSLLMLITERIHVQKRGVTYAVAILIGMAQAVALIPGTSRSGITITIGLLLGLRRSEAVDFSFLLSIPIILAVSLYEARHMAYSGEAAGLYAAGVLSSFIFGMASLTFLIAYLRKRSLDVFAYYRIGLAGLILLFSLVQ